MEIKETLHNITSHNGDRYSEKYNSEGKKECHYKILLDGVAYIFINNQLIESLIVGKPGRIDEIAARKKKHIMDYGIQNNILQTFCNTTVTFKLHNGESYTYDNDIFYISNLLIAEPLRKKYPNKIIKYENIEYIM